MVLRVIAKVISQLLDTCGEQRHLYRSRSLVVLASRKLLDDFLLLYFMQLSLLLAHDGRLGPISSESITGPLINYRPNYIF